MTFVRSGTAFVFHHYFQDRDAVFPLEIFLPIGATFLLTGLGYYAYTYAKMGRFTNMSLLVFSASVIVFVIGLISEQSTTLTYSKS